jgi:lysyl-tRNA synthetase class 2
VEQVEPNLGLDKPLFLTEYPLACSGLSRAFPDRPNRVERWELYVSGLELANACTELTDAVEQDRRFEASTELRRREGRPLYGIDMPFLSAMKLGMPVCAGTAVGMDRLVMLLTNAEEISQVLAFPG